MGVFKDYHFDSLKEKIAPLAFIQWVRLYAYLTLKIKGGQFAETMSFLEKQWQTFVPNAAFTPIFMDDGLESAYRNEFRLRKVAGVSSLLAILVCCLGLFGLAALSAQRRTKEIGVRKVLGASAGQIVTLFSSEFIKLVAFASLIADRAVEGVIDEEKLHHPFPRLLDLRRIGVDHHAVGRGHGAGGDRLGRLLHRDQAHTAIAGDR